MVKDTKSIAVACILVSIAMASIGQVWIKKGLNSLHDLNFSIGLVDSFVKIFLNPFVIVGLLAYFFGVFFWLYGLSKIDLSFAFPFVSLSYVLVFVLSWLFLGEHISALRWIGLATICAGVFILSRS